ncbi:MAG: hypothetical protein HY885_03760 [Deltaproteobacteria bacterium]|nr:hypothetical protein [Deltaproteobacteria bacterium]
MKILLTLLENNIAPRFDLTTKVLIAEAEDGRMADKFKTFVLPEPSADELCSLILKENINAVVCGGIEDTHYQYLLWKKIKVIDRVIAPAELALQKACKGILKSGEIVGFPAIPTPGKNP